MKEVFSAFGIEVFRPLMTLLAPGSVALFPWVVALMQRNATVYALINNNRTESSLLLVLAAVIIGMLLEDVGSRIETHIFDRDLNRLTSGMHTTNWEKYLCLAYGAEPIGARYMRTILLRMKFELGMASAVPIAVGGVFAIHWSVYGSVVLAVAILVVAALLLIEAKKGHAVLSHTRGLLLKGITVLGEENDQRSLYTRHLDDRAQRPPAVLGSQRLHVSANRGLQTAQAVATL